VSRTYEIACLTCKETLWIGQGWPPKAGGVDERFIYTGMPLVMTMLKDFLYRHEAKPDAKHELVFMDDEWLPGRGEFHSVDSAVDGECECARCEKTKEPT
jgi:hypothetical protein